MSVVRSLTEVNRTLPEGADLAAFDPIRTSNSDRFNLY